MWHRGQCGRRTQFIPARYLTCLFRILFFILIMFTFFFLSLSLTHSLTHQYTQTHTHVRYTIISSPLRVLSRVPTWHRWVICIMFRLRGAFNSSHQCVHTLQRIPRVYSRTKDAFVAAADGSTLPRRTDLLFPGDRVRVKTDETVEEKKRGHYVSSEFHLPRSRAAEPLAPVAAGKTSSVMVITQPNTIISTATAAR